MQNRKSSNRLVTSFLLVLLVAGGIFTFWQIQKTQELRQRASEVTWHTAQSATPACGTSGSVLITVSFTNAETTRSMKVQATDEQSGVIVDLGVIDPGKTTTGQIDTKMTSIKSGTVDFKLAWTDGSTQTDMRTATYSAVSQCAAPVCTQSNKAVCSWDALPGAAKYTVTVTDTNTGDTIDTQTVSGTQLVFNSTPGGVYKCSVSAVNVCGNGNASEGTGAACPVGPTPTPGVCVPNQSTCSWDALPGVSKYNVSIINTDTGDTIKSGEVTAPDTSFTFPSDTGTSYQCNVTPVNACGAGPTTKGQPTICQQPTPTPPSETPSPSDTPTPTDTPVPTDTPAPTATPYPTFTPAPTQTPYPTYTPAPTPTPVVIVKTLPTTPPQVIHVPGPTQIVQVPGPQQVVQVPVQQQVVVQPTTAPTIAPTGSTATTFIVLGVGGLFVTLGGLLFFIL